MGRRRALTPEERREIDILVGRGLSNRAIGRLLNRSHKVVKRYRDLGVRYGQRSYKKRKSKLTRRQIRAILRDASNGIISTAKIKQIHNLPVHRQTIWRVLKNAAHLRFRRLKARPMMTPFHEGIRLNWAREFMSWTTEWRKVIFSDEKKFNLDGPDGFQCYYHDLRKEPRYYSKRPAGGGSVFVWGAVSYNGVFQLVIITGKQTGKRYLELLKEHLEPQANNLVGPDFIFQQDNASIHTAKVVEKWFEAKNIAVLDWPAKSPDLNIIENLWGILVRRVYASGRQFNSKPELQNAILTEWASITVQDIRPLYDSLPDRIFQVIRSQGRSTKY